MSKATISLFFVSLILLTASSDLWAASLEEKYIKTRNDFIRQLEKTTTPDDSVALTKLEKQLRTIIVPIKIQEFPKQGKINLLTLLNDELGFGQVDGLRFDFGRTSNFITTANLLNHYIADHPNLPKDLQGISKNGDSYSHIFQSDAAVTNFAELPISSSATSKYAYAFLGATA